jgi:hypothetical protein
MRGVFAKLSGVSLAKALAPIAGHCQQLDWAVELYYGPLRHPFYMEQEPQNLLAWHHWTEGLPMGWFQRGFLPKHADALYVDEQSRYLGFDRKQLPPDELARRLGDKGIGATPEVMQLMTEFNLLLILWIVDGWWEVYTSNSKLLEELHAAWEAKWVDSERWQKDENPYPG